MTYLTELNLNNPRWFEAFSLAEMMIVMLILSIVLAASMPIITKRVVANEKAVEIDIPAGIISPYAGVIIPDGWVLCDGESYATTGKYADLYDVIGYTYGGNGSNFNVPDLRGRVTIGMGTVTDSASVPNTDTYSLGDRNGEIKHVLTVDEMPKHSHDGYTDSKGEHTHTFSSSAMGVSSSYRTGYTSSKGGVGAMDGYSVSQTSYYAGFPFVSLSGAIITAGAHTHNVYTYESGGSTAYNNMQPYLVLNYIIKY